MDQRYFVSLFILALLIFFAWAIAPDNVVPQEDSVQSQKANIAIVGQEVEPTQTDPASTLLTSVSTAQAVPIIGLASEPKVSAKVDELAFAGQIEKQDDLNTIPDRQATNEATVPILSVAFKRQRGLGTTSQSNPAKLEPVRSFGMPNTQEPLAKLPNNRMVLKPIAKIGNPFSGQASNGPDQSEGTRANSSGDPLFGLISGSSNRMQLHGQADLNHPKATLTSGQNLQQPTRFSSVRSDKSQSSLIVRRDQYIWHVVGPSESLNSISVQYFGDDSQAAKIVALNADLISDPQLLPVGEAIRVPSR